MSVDDNLKFYLRKVREHSDMMYKLVAESNPEGKMWRPEGVDKTEQDKRIASAVWHAHEISKYLSAANYRLEKQDV
jgi:hypothetical protein